MGQVVRYTYDDYHNLIDVIDPAGNVPNRNYYDENGRLIASEDAYGNRVELDHDVAGRQEVVYDRNGNMQVYSYDERGNVLQHTDPLGNTTLYTYDQDDNETSVTIAAGTAQAATTTRTFDADGNVLSETDPLGHTTTTAYNSFGDPVTVTDAAGHLHSYSYDANGRPTVIADPLGQRVMAAYSLDLATGLRTTAVSNALGEGLTLVENVRGWVVEETDAAGAFTAFQHDLLGNVIRETTTRTDDNGTVHTATIRREYDANSQILWEEAPDGGITHFEYDSLGNLIAVVDPQGSRTEYRYDARGNQTQVIYADGSVAVTTYDEHGNQLTQTDRNGNMQVTRYDLLNRPVETVAADGSSALTLYDAAGRVAAVIDGRGGETSYAYDLAGRLIETIGPRGGVVRQDYDALGNLIRSTDARGHQTLYRYDARQRQIETEYADGTLETHHYNAGDRLTAITDVLGHQTAFRYDGESRLTAVVDANGHETRYSYDQRGNRTAQIDALGRTTTWRYDDFGRSLGRTLPMGQANAHQYDTFGNRTATTDFNGQTTQFQYDDLGRETQRVYADGQTTAFTYTVSGRVAAAVDDRGTITYRYDVRDRLSEVIQPDGTWLRYDYDVNSNVIALITPWGVTRYSYDAADQITAITAPDGSTLTYSYDLAGNRTAIQYPNGLITRLGYDTRNRPIWIETVDAMGTIIARADYTLDARGYRTRIDELGGKVTQYSYDAQGRLIGERIDDPILGLRDLHYSYDAAGNRVSKTENGVTTAYQYDANDRLTQAGSDTYSYDANGNTLSRVEAGQITHFVYDGENRLIEATGPFGLQTFAYDHTGIRGAESLNGTETRYLVDTNRTYAEVVATYQPGTVGIPAVFDSTVPNASALYSHGQDLAVIQTDAGSYYPHSDAQGNITALSGNGSSFTDRYSYDAWGTPLASTGSTENPYRYSGEWWNSTLGHTYLRARSYNPRIGRFQTMDAWPGRPNEPITLNKYQYANANPAMHTDPSGFATMVETMAPISIQINWAQVGIVGAGVFISAAVHQLGYPIMMADVSRELRAKSKDNVSVRVQPRVAPKEGMHGHHMIPKYMGGGIHQKVVEMYASDHRRLHSQLAAFGHSFEELLGEKFKKHLKVLSIGNRKPLKRLAQTPMGRRQIVKELEFFYIGSGWFAHPLYRARFKYSWDIEEPLFIGGKPPYP